MSNEFKEIVNEIVKEIQEEVYIKGEILERIVGLFLSLKKGKFPGNKPPRGLLFYGPPGTGKTLLMKTLANKLGLSEPIMIRGPEIISQYYGKSEARLRQIFTLAKERAEDENLAIIYIDELDSLAPRRDLTKGELEQRMVGQLLSLMDGLEKEVSKGHVIVIGSTNRPESLDPALRRPGRFDLEIEFDPPNADEREKILKIILDNYAPERYKNVNLDEIAEKTIGFTGADLLQILNESLLQAALEGRESINQEDLLMAKNRVKPSALRGFLLETPIDKSGEIKNDGEIKNEDIINKIEKIAEDFLKNEKIGEDSSKESQFNPILLSQSLSLSDKIASTIAFKVCQELPCPYIVVSATWFRTRWFGEMEKSIRDLFEKIKRSQPCVVYIKNFDAIATAQDEHLHGAILELLDNFEEFKKNNTKVLILCSAKDKIDDQFCEYFKDFKEVI